MNHKTKFDAILKQPVSKKNNNGSETNLQFQFTILNNNEKKELLKQLKIINEYELCINIDIDTTDYLTDDAVEDILLGEGKNGFVLKYASKSLPGQNKIAIKFLTDSEKFDIENKNNEVVKESFEKEGRKENIIEVYANGNVSVRLQGHTYKLYYIAMELVTNDLEGLICEKSKDDYDLKIQYYNLVFRRLIEDINVLHKNGKIHRDLKPANILIKGEYPILADFGLLAEKDSGEIKKGPRYWPTPEYVEPCDNEDQMVDNMTDIFQLGCIFFWMITKKYPIGVIDIKNELKNAQIDDNLTTLLANMLAYKKSDRSCKPLVK